MANNGYDLESIRRDFPILAQQVHGKPLVYLDNAASSQKPECVIEAIGNYYRYDHANIHRGVHALSERATGMFENVREQMAKLLNAQSSDEIIFTRGATESLNLVASSYCADFVNPGDEILISTMEHHSNLVPWQIAAKKCQAVVKAIPINDLGELSIDGLAELLTEKTRVVAITHVSNALGTINPIKEICALAHRHGAIVVVDGAQAAPHLQIDVADLDCDFYAITGHKMYAPTDVGVLYGKKSLLDAMPPYQGGGEMIKQVTLTDFEINTLPHKFEAGTPPIAGVIGLGAAINYIQNLGMERIAAHEQRLLAYATEQLKQIPELQIIGMARCKAAVVSFVLEGIHPHDLGTFLDYDGVAVRTGHHCAMPVMTRFSIPATTRASFALYNTHEEIDVLVKGIRSAKAMFER